MLGGRIEDGVESSEPQAAGLGLLPVETSFEEEKILGRPEGRAPGFANTDVTGYEIHHGRIKRGGGEPLFRIGANVEGCSIGATLGTSWHGVLESDDFRRSFLQWVAAHRSLDWRPGEQSFAAAREAQLEKLGDLIAENIDREALMGLIYDGPSPGLPVIRHQASGIRLQEENSNGASEADNVRLADAEVPSAASSAAMDTMPANLMPDA
jgi:adenosylcobyric acid synthase